MMLPDRISFSQELGAALVAPKPVQRVNELLRCFLTTAPAPWESDDQRLLRTIVERLDTASGDPGRLLILAQDVKQLLDRASSSDQVELLLELFAERQRVLGVMRKHATGAITRAGFLSFIGEQRWSDVVRRRMAALSSVEFANVMDALEGSDVMRLETILTA